MTSDVPLLYRTQSRTTTQPRILGVCWIVYGVFRMAMTLWLIAFTTTATLMFGALLSRVPDPFSLMAAFHFLYLGIVMWSAACGVVSILAGFTLLARQRSSRALAIVAALLSLPELPFGVILGVYTLVVQLPTTAAPPYVTGATGPL
jgi:hypothetical protein